jgi:hypothetical protein
VPAAPSGLAAVVASSTSLSISWLDNSNNESGFWLQQSTSATNFSGAVSTYPAQNATAATITGLTTGTTYYYKIVAYNADGNSADSNLANGTPATSSAPLAPNNLVASAVTSSSNVSLTWGDLATNETGYKVYRKLSTGTWTGTPVATLSANVATWTDTTTAGGQTYNYAVAAYNAIGENWSNTATVTTNSPASPVAPQITNLTANSSTSIAVTWSAAVGGTGTPSYNIYRRVGNGNFASDPSNNITVATGLTTLTYTDQGGANPVQPNTTYFYIIQATNGATGFQWSSGANSVSTPNSSTTIINEATLGSDSVNIDRSTLTNTNQAVASFTGNGTYQFSGVANAGDNDYYKITSTVAGTLNVSPNSLNGVSGIFITLRNESASDYIDLGTDSVSIPAGGTRYLLINNWGSASQNYNSTNLPSVSFEAGGGGGTASIAIPAGTTARSQPVPLTSLMSAPNPTLSVGVMSIVPPTGLASAAWWVSPSNTNASTDIAIAGTGFNDRRDVRVKNSESLFLWVAGSYSAAYAFNVTINEAQAASANTIRNIANGVNVSNWFRFIRSGAQIDTGYLATSDLNELLASGVESIRLAISPKWLLGGSNTDQVWDGTSTTLVADTVTKLTSVINTLKAHTSGTRSFKSIILVAHGFELGGPSSPIESLSGAVDNFATLWGNIASSFASLSSKVVFELLNEPKFSSNPRRWDLMQDKAVASIRTAAPSSTIISSDSSNGTLDQPFLSTIRPSAHANVIYSFHYYRVFEYSHQGAAALRFDGTIQGWLHHVPAPRYDGSNAVGSLWDNERAAGLARVNGWMTNKYTFSSLTTDEKDAFRSYLGALGWGTPNGAGGYNAPASSQAATWWNTSPGYSFYDPRPVDGSKPAQGDSALPNYNPIVGSTTGSRLQWAWTALAQYRYYFLDDVRTFNDSSFSTATSQEQLASVSIAGVASTSNAWNVRSYMGEYGAVRHDDHNTFQGVTYNADDQRRSYLAAIANAAHANKIPSAIWGYDDQQWFGIGADLQNPNGGRVINTPTSAFFQIDSSIATLVLGKVTTSY